MNSIASSMRPYRFRVEYTFSRTEVPEGWRFSYGVATEIGGAESWLLKGLGGLLLQGPAPILSVSHSALKQGGGVSQKKGSLFVQNCFCFESYLPMLEDKMGGRIRKLFRVGKMYRMPFRRIGSLIATLRVARLTSQTRKLWLGWSESRPTETLA